jgi:hypothetical protein
LAVSYVDYTPLGGILHAIFCTTGGKDQDYFTGKSIFPWRSHGHSIGAFMDARFHRGKISKKA